MKWKLWRKAIKKIIEDDPKVIHRYVLMSGDGITTGPSWSWAGSWRGRIDTLGRETWAIFTSEAGSAGKRSFIVLLPYTANPPEADDRILVYNEDGSQAGELRVNFVVKYHHKIDVNVEQIAP